MYRCITSLCMHFNLCSCNVNKCKVVKLDVGSQSSRSKPDNINWKLCCLCQEERNDHLQCMINAKGPNCGYEYLATNLLGFQNLNSLTMNVKLDKWMKSQALLKHCNHILPCITNPVT